MPRPINTRRLRRLRGVAFACGVAALGASVGCTSMVTTRAIEQFQTHLEAGDLSSLAASTTESFRTTALPDPSALTTFDLLDVPVGEVTIVEVREPSDTKRDVDVTIEGSNQKLTYHLVKKADSIGRSKWLVDEITMRQGGSKRAVAKTVSDQMSLLLGVRDTVRLWQSGDAEAVSANAAGELAKSLADVPPTWQTQLAGRFFGGVLKSKPRAKLIKGQAQVELSHKEGRLKLVLDDGPDGWQVRTAVLVGRDKDIEREARTEAATLATVAKFARGYAAADRTVLEETAGEDLFTNALSGGDLSVVTLDAEAVIAGQYELRTAGETSELSVEIGDETKQFSLVRRGGSGRDRVVSELTTYENGQTKKLSAQLLVMPTVELFAKSYASGDVDSLRHLTTSEWAVPVWDACTPQREDALLAMPLPMLELTPADPADAPVVRYDGPSIEVRQVTSEAVVSYRLDAAGGRVLVNDVELIDLRGATRLRDRLALALTMDQAADAILTGDLNALKAASSASLNRLVWDWSAPEDLPVALDLIPLLKAPILTVDSRGEESILTVGHDHATARITLTGARPKLEEVVYLDVSGVETNRITHAARVHRASLR